MWWTKASRQCTPATKVFLRIEALDVAKQLNQSPLHTDTLGTGKEVPKTFVEKAFSQSLPPAIESKGYISTTMKGLISTQPLSPCWFFPVLLG